jgi:hypothetical protein
MHPTILAKRRLDAQNRSMAAATLLSERFGVALPTARQVRQPDIAQLFKWEALAAFLESLANTPAGISLADVLATDGLSKTAANAIKKHFGEESTDEE